MIFGYRPAYRGRRDAGAGGGSPPSGLRVDSTTVTIDTATITVDQG